MYHRLSSINRGALPFESLVLYIYRPRGTIKSINHSTNGDRTDDPCYHTFDGMSQHRPPPPLGHRHTVDVVDGHK
jgi:hypothetical protein